MQHCLAVIPDTQIVRPRCPIAPLPACRSFQQFRDQGIHSADIPTLRGFVAGELGEGQAQLAADDLGRRNTSLAAQRREAALGRQESSPAWGKRHEEPPSHAGRPHLL